MSIRKRIIIAVAIQAILIFIICIFAYISFDTVLSKLRAIEIIDDLNISLLEMRKAEKNYLLEKNNDALKELVEIGMERLEIIQSSKSYIVPGLGKNIFYDLLNNLNQYLELAKGVIATNITPPHFESQFRNLGHELTNLSELLLKRERQNVNRIIFSIVVRLFVSLGVIFIFQVIVWKYFFSFIIKELAVMEHLIKMISQGRFHEVAVKSISPHNEIDSAIKAITDMSRELERREAELIQSGKLASLGVLVSGVAHELGNPLNNISMMAQTYISIYDMLGDEEKKTFMGDILNQTERIKKIIQNLLDFSRSKKQELKDYNPGDIVEQSIEFVDNHLKISKVKLHKSIAANLPPIFVDASQIQQVLVNLYINAIQAMPQGGGLFIEVYPSQKNGSVVIKVRDTGTGINKEILPYIFDPFFSTKGTKGTGLGLSVSYGMVRQHHGDISVESQEGKGTTFLVKIPFHQGKEGEGNAQ